MKLNIWLHGICIECPACRLSMTWEDIACGCSFGYIGKFDKKGLHESDLSSCGQTENRLQGDGKNQSQANDFSLALFLRCIQELEKEEYRKMERLFSQQEKSLTRGEGREWE